MRDSGEGAQLTHETGGIGRIGPHFSVDLDQAAHDDRENLFAGKCVLEAVTEEHGQGKGFSKLVGTRRGAGSLSLTL